MDPITLIGGIACGASLVGLAFLSGHEHGKKSGIMRERNLADLRIKGLLERENRRAPRSRRARK